MGEAYVVLNDGETFTGILGSHVVRITGEVTPEVEDLINSGDIASVSDMIVEGKIEGNLIAVRDLLQLHRLVGDMEPSDFANTARANALVDFFSNYLGED